jgi:integrase
MSADSSRQIAVRKPRPDFPLFPHATGRWAKKVRGKLCYFGKTADDPKGARALDLWNDQKDDLLAGRTPRGKSDGLTVGELCDRFLQSKDKAVDAGEITRRTRDDYKSVTDRIVGQFGKSRMVIDLGGDDFESLRATFAKTRGPVALGNEIQRVRVILKYAYDAELIDRPVRVGPTFKKPSKKVLRLDRAKRGSKMLEPADLHRLIEGADIQLRPMILLALNCGFGNSDCGTLPLAALDLDAAWVSYHRPKTGIARRCALWPETVEALRAAIAERPTPKTPEAEPLVFVTKYGASWAKETIDNPICKKFRKLLDASGLHRPGLGFYSLRHIFRTIADGAKDQPAANAIMGHSDPSMAGAYRERIDDSRLRAVADYVRAWLFAEIVTNERAEPEMAAAKAKRRPRPTVKSKPAAKRQAMAEASEGFALRIVG